MKITLKVINGIQSYTRLIVRAELSVVFDTIDHIISSITAQLSGTAPISFQSIWWLL